ncbi:MAG: ABC transporter permease [Bacillota bacterium]|nr:ABC transporter permease [Bacillota bacterium]
MRDLTTVLACMISAGTPILYALIGDLIGERAGIISLSVEGSMLCGACIGFGTAVATHNMLFAVLSGALAGGLIGFCQAFLTIDRKSNMMASGFVLMFFAMGLTAFYGRSLLNISIGGANSAGLGKIAIPVLSKIPVLGTALFTQDILTYISYLLPLIVYFFIYKTKYGLILCSVGERPEVTLAYGYNPRLIQYGAVIMAGVLAGIGGVQMSVIYTMGWANNMVNGRGFIATALVILCSWKPQRAYLAAYLFGLAQALQIFLQVHSVPVSMYITLMLPYLLTLVALGFISSSKKPTMPEKLKIVI